MKKFKTILCSVLVLVMIMSSNVCAYKMYSLDGRSVDVNYDDAQAWRNVGWYDQPVQQVYSLDGRTEIIYKSQFAAWKSVGWYEEPVTVMYALDGRTTVVAKSQINAWKKVGWYEEPVQVMYAPDGRTTVVAKSQVNAWKKVGWYTYPVSNSYSSYKNEYKYTLQQKINKGSLSSDARFSLIYINNDNIPELLIHQGSYRGAKTEVYTFYNNRAVHLGNFYSSDCLYYQHKNNRFLSLYVDGTTEIVDVYTISGNKTVKVIAFSANVSLYSSSYYTSCYINGKSVSKSKYVNTKIAYDMSECDVGRYECATHFSGYQLSSYNINRILG